jgi:hypothetical protein
LARATRVMTRPVSLDVYRSFTDPRGTGNRIRRYSIVSAELILHWLSTDREHLRPRQDLQCQKATRWIRSYRRLKIVSAVYFVKTQSLDVNDHRIGPTTLRRELR